METFLNKIESPIIFRFATAIFEENFSHQKNNDKFGIKRFSNPRSSNRLYVREIIVNNNNNNDKRGA